MRPISTQVTPSSASNGFKILGQSPIGFLLVISLSVGCLDPVPEEVTASAASTSEPERPTTAFSKLDIVIDLQEPSRPADVPIGPLRVFIQQKETSLSMDIELTDVVEVMPVEFSIPNVADGPLRITVYEDKNGNDAFDDCPFPHLPRHTEVIDSRDRLSATLDRPDGVNESSLLMNLSHTICGPGQTDTGVEGTIEFPEGAEPDGSTVYLYLEPEDQEEAGQEIIAPLRVPLYIGSSAGESRGFSLGELLPGRYAITGFTDNDGDHSPSPCGGQLGGGDRYAVRIEGVEVLPGQRRTINTPLTLRSMGCSDEPTGISGQLTMGAELQSQNTQIWRGLWGVLEGAASINLVGNGLDPSEQSWRLFPSIVSRPLPQTFTVTGVDAGLYRVELFLDRDGDGRFLPCDGTPKGFDSIYAIAEDVRVQPGEIVDIGQLELRSANCSDEPVTGLIGQVTSTIEPGSEGSGRPVRLELYPLDTSSERLSFKMFSNHWKLPGGTASFTQEVPRGSYRGQFYLDNNRDGDFSECTNAPFADRAAAPPFVVDLTPGALVDIGSQALEGFACPPVFNGLNFQIDPGESGNAFSEESLRVFIREAGGWHNDQPLVTIENSGLWLSDELSVATGQYHLIVYLDEDADENYGPCLDGVGDSIIAEAMIELDGSESHRTVLLELANECP